MNIKIKNQGEITAIVKVLRNQGKKIVLLSGSFDILHSDHIESFKEAKSQGDILIVLLNSDQSIKIYKGPNHPINAMEERAKVLSAIQYIDYIVVFDDITPNEVISKIKPDIFCNGKEWGKNCVERDAVEKYGGKMYIFKHPLLVSTSQVVKKIIHSYMEPDVKAVFLDRDGTININKPEYVHKIEDFKFIPGTLSALKKLSETEYKIIVITNQSGIARGYYNKKDLTGLNKWLLKTLKENGIRIDKIYFCPHGPDNGCSCRKPEIGMFLKAALDFKINLSKSWVIGDKKTDIVAGRASNIKTIKIGSRMPKSLKLEPNYYAKDLSEAVQIIHK